MTSRSRIRLALALGLASAHAEDLRAQPLHPDDARLHAFSVLEPRATLRVRFDDGEEARGDFVAVEGTDVLLKAGGEENPYRITRIAGIQERGRVTLKGILVGAAVGTLYMAVMTPMGYNAPYCKDCGFDSKDTAILYASGAILGASSAMLWQRLRWHTRYP